MAKTKGRDARQPWIKFFTRDWRSNARLRICSYAARGLWIDLITLMAESPVFGFLMIEGVIPTVRQLAALLGGSERETAKLLDELGEANVYSMTGGDDYPADILPLIPADMPGGVIFSRRMVRDKAKADRDAANGKGGGNPNLLPQDKPAVNPPGKPSEIRDQNPDPTHGKTSTDPQRAPAQQGARAGTSMPEDPWQQRLKDYKPGGFWIGAWGPRPESGQCYAPKEMLARLQGPSHDAQPKADAA